MEKIGFNEVSDLVVFSDIYGILQHWDCKKGFSYLDTPRPNHGFLFILCDRVVITYADKESESYSKGTVLYLPEGLCYGISFYGVANEEKITLLINFKMHTTGGASLCFGTKIFATATGMGELYADEFYKIIFAFKNTHNSMPLIKASFYKIIDNILKHALADTEHGRVMPAIVYIDRHIEETISVSKLAKLCALSETCFRKYFKADMGMPSSKYIRKRKIEKAMEILRIPESTIGDAAYGLGFYDLSYFCKCFKSETGITPQSYKKRHTDKGGELR